MTGYDKLTQKASVALFSVAVTLLSAGEVSANTGDLHKMVGTVNANLANIPDLLSTIAYIAGAGLGIAGVFKLKQHVDNPEQVALKDGLVRVGAGGGLIAIPAVLNMMISTLGVGNTGVSQMSF